MRDPGYDPEAGAWFAPIGYTQLISDNPTTEQALGERLS